MKFVVIFLCFQKIFAVLENEKFGENLANPSNNLISSDSLERQKCGQLLIDIRKAFKKSDKSNQWANASEF